MRPQFNLLLLATALFALTAQAQSSSDVIVYDVNGTRTITSAAGDAAAVLDPLVLDSALSGGFQRSLHQGTAAAAQETLRGAATLSTYHASKPNLFTASTDVSFGKRVQVLPGTSGLALGTPVQFSVDLRLDGQIGTGYLDATTFAGLPTYRDIARSLASSEVRLDYRIRDLDQSRKIVMSFGYFGRSYFDAKYYAWTGAEGEIESRWGPDGEWIGGTLPSPNNYDFKTTTITSSDALIHFPDTSLRRYTVSTFVGDTLEITGDLNLFMQAMGQGTQSQATGYFMESFDAGLTSDLGLEFVGETAGVFAVPEPGTGVLALVGILLVGTEVSRRRCSTLQRSC